MDIIKISLILLQLGTLIFICASVNVDNWAMACFFLIAHFRLRDVFIDWSEE